MPGLPTSSHPQYLRCRLEPFSILVHFSSALIKQSPSQAQERPWCMSTRWQFLNGSTRPRSYRIIMLTQTRAGDSHPAYSQENSLPWSEISTRGHWQYLRILSLSKDCPVLHGHGRACDMLSWWYEPCLNSSTQTGLGLWSGPWVWQVARRVLNLRHHENKPYL